MKLRKLAASALAMCLAASCLLSPEAPALPDNLVVTAYADTEPGIYSGANYKLKYKENPDGSINIIDCITEGDRVTVNIPSTIMVDRNGVDTPVAVTTIGASGYTVFKEKTNIVNVKLPASIRYIEKDTFYKCYDLGAININSSDDFSYDERILPERRPCYYTDGGVLYSVNPDNRTMELMCFPKGRAQKDFRIPRPDSAQNSTPAGYTVTSIGERAFYDSTYLEKVNIPKTVVNIKREAFAYCKMLTEVYILDVKNMRYGDIEPAVFEKTYENDGFKAYCYTNSEADTYFRNLNIRPVSLYFPYSPSNVKAELDKSSSGYSVKVTWDEAVNADGYLVYRAEGSKDAKKMMLSYFDDPITDAVADDGDPENGIPKRYYYIDDTAEAGKTYYYFIKSVTIIDSETIEGEPEEFSPFAKILVKVKEVYGMVAAPFNKEDSLTVYLYRGKENDPNKLLIAETEISSGDANKIYNFFVSEEDSAGTYTVKFVMRGCVSRSYEFKMTEDVNEYIQNAHIRLRGDIDGDNALTAVDVSSILLYLIRDPDEPDVILYNDDYLKKVANVYDDYDEEDIIDIHDARELLRRTQY